MGKPNYDNTYWCNKGKHEALSAELNKLVPSSGEIPGWSADHNAALETFRIASNCYYDLYNNGLGNRGAEFIEAFGFCAIALAENGRDDCDDFSDHGHLYHPIELTQELIDRTEAKMDEIIVLAAHEQHIGEVKADTIDITPRGCETAEGTERVRKAQQEWDDVTHQLANTLSQIMADDDKPTTDDIQQLRALLGARDRKQEAFLRAVAGR